MEYHRPAPNLIGHLQFSKYELQFLYMVGRNDKIPHLMGLQYAGRPKQYTGNFGAYAVKKGRITMQLLEKLVQKYYKTNA